MNASSHDNIITRALNAEVGEYKSGGASWLIFSFIAQGALLFLLRRARPVETAELVLFLIASFFFAWWPFVRGIRQLRRASSLSRPDDSLRRALTFDTRLIKHINLGTHKTIWTRLYNLVGTLINSAAHSAQNSWDQYGITGTGETVNSQLPCIVVTLNDNQEHRLTSTSDAEKLKELIAALRAHAPHATPAPVPVSTADDWLNEGGWRSTMRAMLLLFGIPLMFICSIILFAQYMNARERADMQLHFVKTTATISRLSDYGGEGSDYNVAVNFTDQNGKAIEAGTVKLVSKADFQKLKVGAPVEIFYKPQDPREFRLALSLERLDGDKGTSKVLSILTALGFLMTLVATISIVRMKLRKRAGRTQGASVGAMASSRT